MISNKDIRVEGGNLIINGKKNPIVQDILLYAISDAGLNVGDTFQIPSEMLDRKLITINFNRAAWSGSVTITTEMIKGGDCTGGLKIVTGDKNNPTVDKYIIFDISPTGVITIDYINNWSAPYVRVNAL